MGDENKPSDSTLRCPIKDERNGVIYQCSKHFGHENVRGDEEHVVIAAEYVHKSTDWQGLFEEARPLLEWMANQEQKLGPVISNHARRTLVRAYLGSSPRPGIAKAPNRIAS